MDWGIGHAGLVVGAGVGALLIAVLYWVFSGRRWPRVAIALTIAGSACIVSGPIGQWLSGITMTVDGWISGLVAQLTGAIVISGLIALCLVMPLWIQIQSGRITTGTIVMGAVSPIAIAMIPGTVGYWLSTGLGWIAWLVTWPIAAGLGWH